MKTEIRIFKDLESLSRDAATLFVEQATQSITERGRFLVALNGGSTPNRLFQLLATEYKDKVDWSKSTSSGATNDASHRMTPKAVMDKRGNCF